MGAKKDESTGVAARRASTIFAAEDSWTMRLAKSLQVRHSACYSHSSQVACRTV